MASIERSVSVRLHVFGLPRQAGVARVRERDAGERATRAAVAAGGCVLLAAACVFLPIAHFVLVPGFLVAAPIVALRRLRESASIVALAGACPRCTSERTFDVKGAFGPGMKTACLVCSFPIDIEPVG